MENNHSWFWVHKHTKYWHKRTDTNRWVWQERTHEKQKDRRQAGISRVQSFNLLQSKSAQHNSEAPHPDVNLLSLLVGVWETSRGLFPQVKWKNKNKESVSNDYTDPYVWQMCVSSARYCHFHFTAAKASGAVFSPRTQDTTDLLVS